jgi:hypothetical protein
MLKNKKGFRLEAFLIMYPGWEFRLLTQILSLFTHIYHKNQLGRWFQAKLKNIR